MTVPAAALVAADAPPSRFTFDERAGRYRTARGTFVREAAVRDALDRVLAAAESQTRALGDLLRTRQVPVAEWERRMRLACKDAHLQAYAAAQGGWAQLSPADYGRIGADVRRQYAYLRRFRRQLEDGTQLMDGRFTRRMAQYVNAGRVRYHAVERAEKERRGYAEARRVRGAADSCPGCVAAAARG